MLREKDGARAASSILLLVLPVAIMPIFLNIWAGANYAKFGMTSTEVVRELWLIALYFLIGGLIIIFIGRDRGHKEFVFAIRLFTVAIFLALSYNQITVSQMIAPIKTEFKKTAAGCKVRSGELVCGDALKNVLAARDQALKKISVIRIGDWKAAAPNVHSIETECDSAYFYFPF